MCVCVEGWWVVGAVYPLESEGNWRKEPALLLSYLDLHYDMYCHLVLHNQINIMLTQNSLGNL